MAILHLLNSMHSYNFGFMDIDRGKEHFKGNVLATMHHNLAAHSFYVL